MNKNRLSFAYMACNQFNPRAIISSSFFLNSCVCEEEFASCLILLLLSLVTHRLDKQLHDSVALFSLLDTRELFVTYSVRHSRNLLRKKSLNETTENGHYHNFYSGFFFFLSLSLASLWFAFFSLLVCESENYLKEIQYCVTFNTL